GRLRLNRPFKRRQVMTCDTRRPDLFIEFANDRGKFATAEPQGPLIKVAVPALTVVKDEGVREVFDGGAETLLTLPQRLLGLLPLRERLFQFVVLFKEFAPLPFVLAPQRHALDSVVDRMYQVNRSESVFVEVILSPRFERRDGDGDILLPRQHDHWADRFFA